MREKTELHEDINSAKQAEAIIKHPLFIAALSTLRELTVSKFESLGFKDITEMQECNIRLNLIEELEAHLFTVIQNGDIAFSKLEQIQTHEQAMNNEY